MKQYTLTLSPKYAAHWGFWEAVRELVQNAYDQRDRSPGCTAEVKYDPDTQQLRIKTSDGRLDRKTLLLGETDKDNDKGLRGKFGEGYKLALLVLARLGYQVRVIMDNEFWVPVIEHDESFDCEVLKINVHQEENSEWGVEFLVYGVGQQTWDEIKPNMIDPSLHGVLGDDQAGRIYVGGLYVTTLKDMKHGYAFRPEGLPLDRDRGVVDRFNVKYATSRIWADRDDDRAAELVSSRAPDVEYVTSHVGTQSRIIAAIERTVPPDVIPVTNQEEVEKAQAAGLKWQLVTEAAKSILRHVRKWFIPSAKSPLERLRDLRKKAQYALNHDLLAELDDIIKTMEGGNAVERT